MFLSDADRNTKLCRCGRTRLGKLYLHSDIALVNRHKGDIGYFNILKSRSVEQSYLYLANVRLYSAFVRYGYSLHICGGGIYAIIIGYLIGVFCPCSACCVIIEKRKVEL